MSIGAIARSLAEPNKGSRQEYPLPYGERDRRAAGTVYHHRQIHLSAAETLRQNEGDLRLSVGPRCQALYWHRLPVDGHLQTALVAQHTLVQARDVDVDHVLRERGVGGVVGHG